MKILRVLGPGTDAALAGELRDAVAAFNRGLDIRLRFLAIGVEDRELTLTTAEDAPAVVGAVLEEFRPEAVVLFGHGEATVAAATLAARCSALVARLGAGVRDGEAASTARAVDHLAQLLLPLDDAAEVILREEGLGARVRRVARGADERDDAPGGDAKPASESSFGRNVIKALRAARARPSGDSSC